MHAVLLEGSQASADAHHFELVNSTTQHPSRSQHGIRLHRCQEQKTGSMSGATLCNTMCCAVPHSAWKQPITRRGV